MKKSRVIPKETRSFPPGYHFFEKKSLPVPTGSCCRKKKKESCSSASGKTAEYIPHYSFEEGEGRKLAHVITYHKTAPLLLKGPKALP